MWQLRQYKLQVFNRAQLATHNGKPEHLPHIGSLELGLHLVERVCDEREGSRIISDQCVSVVLVIDEDGTDGTCEINLYIIELLFVADDDVVKDVGLDRIGPMVEGNLNFLLSKPVFSS